MSPKKTMNYLCDDLRITLKLLYKKLKYILKKFVFSSKFTVFNYIFKKLIKI